MSGLLVEVGVEELPSRDIARASGALAEGLAQAVRDLGLGGGPARAFGTPRRLAAYVPDVAERQPVVEREVRGPARERAYDAGGRPTPALLGFCRSQGIAPEQTTVVETAHGAYVMARVASGGRPATAVLPPAIEAAIAAVPFARTMRWASEGQRFGRPVAWLVCLLGREVLDVSFAGVRAGRESRGHRFLAPGPVPLGSAEDYEARLGDANVLADRSARRSAVLRAVVAAAAAEGLVADVPETLVDEVTDLVELPTAFVGRFAERYLALPDALLTTPMVHHQRQFPTRRRDDGARAAAFVGVRNGDARRLDLVRAGNERVLAARLADAWFFYERDRRTPLETMRQALAGMELGGGLGTMLDRADRVEAVALALARAAGGGDGVATGVDAVARASHLALCDRASHVVGEFPELAGTMAAVYAEASGEAPAVVDALAEAVHPRDAADRLPASNGGRLLALALRAEELVAGFAAGRAPTGSEDPYGMRRAALAVARIGLDGGVPGGVATLIDVAGAGLDGRFTAAALAAARDGAFAFLRERIEGLLVDAGVAPEAAAAVAAAGVLDPLDRLVARGRSLAAMLATEGGDRLITAYRRAARIVRQAGAEAARVAAQADGALEAALEAGGAEAALARRLAAAVSEGEAAAATPERYFALVADLAEPLDALFATVMVLDADPVARARRLGLLARLVAFVSRYADLSGLGRRREEAVAG